MNYNHLLNEYWDYMSFLNLVKHPNSARSRPALTPLVKKNITKPIVKKKQPMYKTSLLTEPRLKITYLPCTIAASSEMINDNEYSYRFVSSSGGKVYAETIDYDYDVQLAYYK